MNCPSYAALTLQEQRDFLGKLIIAVQSDDYCFGGGLNVIAMAESIGVFETTKPGTGREGVGEYAPENLIN